MSFCIDYQRVTKTYGNRQIVQNLSLSLEADVTTAIVGASGSGKSTLLQIGNGLVVPEQGQVSVFDQPLTPASSQQMRLGIGYSQQGAGLFPHLTIYDNATLMARLQHGPQARIDERYRQLMQLLGLSEEFDQRYPYSLSGGQQQRVALARAFVTEPTILLADEPTGNLDGKTGDNVMELLFDLHARKNTTLLLITHAPALADKCERVLTMSDGHITSHERPN